MSNGVLAQSATQLTVPTNGEDEFDFVQQVARIAARKAKGITRERQELNTNKLVTACLADYRIHFAGIYSKGENLPTAIYNKITEAVFAHQSKAFSAVNKDNVISYRRSFFHKADEMEVTERVLITGENVLGLREQHLGATLFLGKAQKRLKDLEAKKTPNYDAEARCKEMIQKCQQTLVYIEGEMKKQEKVIAEAQQTAAKA